MIKQTFKILLDDKRRLRNLILGKKILFLTIVSTLLVSMQIIFQGFAMNINYPVDKEKGNTFFFIVIGAISVFLGQFFILKKWKWQDNIKI